MTRFATFAVVFVALLLPVTAMAGEASTPGPDNGSAVETEYDVIKTRDGSVLVGALGKFNDHILEFYLKDTVKMQTIKRSMIKEITIGRRTYKSKTEIREYDHLWRKGNPDPFIGIIKSEWETETHIFIAPKEFSSDPVDFAKDNIVRIDFRNTAENIFDFRIFHAKVTSNETPRGLYEIAEWAVPYDSLRVRAKALLKRVNRIAPEFADAYGLFSEMFAQDREKGSSTDTEINEEIELYMKASRLRIPLPAIYLEMGKILGARGLGFRAVEAYDLAIEHNRIPAIGGLDEKALVGKGEILLNRGELAEARRAFEKVVEDNPDSYLALQYLADCLTRQNEFDEARQRFRRAIELEPSVPETYLKLARLFLITGDTDKALEEVKNAHSAGGKTVESMTLEGLALARIGYYKESEKVLDQASDAGGSVECSMARGYLLENKLDFEGALDEYKGALTKGEDTGAAHYHLSSAYFSLKKYTEAEASLGMALRRGYDATLAFELYAMVAKAKGNLKDAARYLRYSIAGDPTADRYYALGQVLVMQAETITEDNKRKQAYLNAGDAFASALSENSSHVEALYGMGFVLRRPGGRDAIKQAEEYFKRASAARPDDKRLEVALKRTRLSVRQEIWEDSFDREDYHIIEPSMSTSRYGRWAEEEGNGITISIQGGTCLFNGTQSKVKEERTTLYRPEPLKDENRMRIVRYEATIDGIGARDARFGIRLESWSGNKKHTVILCKNFDGQPSLIYQDKSGKWVPSVLSLSSSFESGRPHTYAIELSDRKKGEVSVYVDNELAATVKVPSMYKGTYYRLGIYGQAKKGTTWSIRVQKVKIFWERPTGSTR